MYVKVHFELMKCINDQLTRAKHASRSAAEASLPKSRERDLFWVEVEIHVYLYFM